MSRMRPLRRARVSSVRLLSTWENRSAPVPELFNTARNVPNRELTALFDVSGGCWVTTSEIYSSSASPVRFPLRRYALTARLSAGGLVRILYDDDNDVKIGEVLEVKCYPRADCKLFTSNFETLPPTRCTDDVDEAGNAGSPSHPPPRKGNILWLPSAPSR